MGTRSHSSYVFKDSETAITVDMRVFWGNTTDEEVVVNELTLSYIELVNRVREQYGSEGKPLL